MQKTHLSTSQCFMVLFFRYFFIKRIKFYYFQHKGFFFYENTFFSFFAIYIFITTFALLK